MKQPKDAVITLSGQKKMCCKYGAWCKVECGHKSEHAQNVACLNMCVMYQEITCCEVKLTMRQRVSKAGDWLVSKLETFL